MTAFRKYCALVIQKLRWSILTSPMAYAVITRAGKAYLDYILIEMKAAGDEKIYQNFLEEGLRMVAGALRLESASANRNRTYRII